jgi:hypothetical protein
MIRAARTDANQSEIVAALRKRGAVCIITSQLKNAFDVLVCFNGKIHIVEIKDGNKPKSARKLTEGELRCKSLVEGVRCSYNVIYSVEEALELIGV